MRNFILLILQLADSALTYIRSVQVYVRMMSCVIALSQYFSCGHFWLSTTHTCHSCFDALLKSKVNSLKFTFESRTIIWFSW